MSRKIGQILLVFAGILLLPSGALFMAFYYWMSVHTARFSPKDAVDGTHYVGAISCYLAGILAAILIFVVLRASYPRNDGRGLKMSQWIDTAIGFAFGSIIVISISPCWLMAAFGFISVAYLDYASRWWVVSKGVQVGDQPSLAA
jgi:hypothetical protein